MDMIDRNGEIHDIPDADVGSAFKSGQYGFAPGTMVPTFGADGAVRSIPASQYDPDKHAIPTAEEQAAAAREEQYGGVGGAAISGAIGAGNALLLGGGKGLAVKAAEAFGSPGAGERTREAIKGYTETNPTANIAGEVVGTVAPLAFGGIEGLAGEGIRGVGAGVRGVDTLGGLAEAGTRALTGEGGAGLLARTAQKALPYAARGATEGAAYGLGGAYSDAVLDNEPLTAERLWTGAKHGALFGGAVGAGLGAGSSLIEDAAKTVMPKIRGAVEEFAEDRAFKAAGGLKSWAKKAEARAGGAEEISKDLLARGHIQPGWSVDQVAESVGKDAEATGQKLGNMMKELDAAAVARGEGNLVDGSKVVKRAYEEVVQPLLDNPAKRDLGEAMAKRLEPFVEDFAGNEIGHAKLWDIRKGLDERIRWDSRAANPMADELKKFRGILEDELTTSADKAARDLGISDTFAKDWQETKRLYSSLRFASDMASDGLAGKLGNNWASLTDQIAGGFGALTGFGEHSGHGLSALSLLHPQAAAAALLTTAAHKVLRERGSSVLAYAADKLSKVGAVAEEAASVDKKIGDAIDKFLSKGAAVPAKLAAQNPDQIGALAAGTVGPGPNVIPLQTSKTPKSLDGQYHQATAAVSKLASQAEATRDHTEQTLGPMIQNAPGVAMVIQNKQAKAIDFLKAKMPMQAVAPPLSMTPQRGVTDMAKAKFMRYVKTLQRPMTAINDLSHNKLSSESVEALKAVLPETYSDVKTKVMDRVTAMAEQGKTVAYTQKLQIGRLFGVAVDPTQSPQFTKAIGDLFASMNSDTAKPPEQIQPSQGMAGGSAHKVDTSKAIETRTQQLETA